MTFGSRLQGRRKELNLTQKQLAAQVGVATSTLAGYESNIRQPDLDKLVLLARALDTSTDGLLGLDPQEDIHCAQQQLLFTDDPAQTLLVGYQPTLCSQTKKQELIQRIAKEIMESDLS